MIRRFITILFLLVYACSVIGWTQIWAAEHAHDSKRGGGGHQARISEWHRRPARQLWQTKILEDGSVLVSPFISSNPPHFETALQHSSVGFAAGQSAQVFASRAPPTALV
jgi:hypothetical protein